jgi:hypothetical protein
LIEVPTEEEIIQPVPVMEEIQVLQEEVLPLTHKVCSYCKVNKPREEYGFYTKKTKRNTIIRSRCKECEKVIEGAKYRKRVENKGGSDKCPPKPNRYTDRYQKEQTFEFLILLGWKFNEEKGIWWKEGLKTEDGVFINIPKDVRTRKRTPKPKPFKEPKKLGRKLHIAWERKDDIRKLRKEGMTFDELAKVFSTSNPTIRAIVSAEYEK